MIELETRDFRHGAPLFKNYCYLVVDRTDGEMLAVFDRRGQAFQFISHRLDDEWKEELKRLGKRKGLTIKVVEGGRYKIVKARKEKRQEG